MNASWPINPLIQIELNYKLSVHLLVYSTQPVIIYIVLVLVLDLIFSTHETVDPIY